jgi:hypothetical protein
MDQRIYVYIDEKNVKCYPNLRQLANANPAVPYFSISKLLKTTSMVKRDVFTVAVSRLLWKTNRSFKKGGYDK